MCSNFHGVGTYLVAFSTIKIYFYTLPRLWYEEFCGSHFYARFSCICRIVSLVVRNKFTLYFINFQHMVGTGMANPFPAAAAAAAAAAQYAANGGDSLAGVKAESGPPQPPQPPQPPLVKSEGPPPPAPLPPANFSPQPPPQPHPPNPIENQNNTAVSFSCDVLKLSGEEM